MEVEDELIYIARMGSRISRDAALNPTGSRNHKHSHSVQNLNCNGFHCFILGSNDPTSKSFLPFLVVWLSVPWDIKSNRLDSHW
jgi:hypothetical protein